MEHSKLKNLVTSYIKAQINNVSIFDYPDALQLNADVNKIQGQIELATELKIISKSKRIDLEAELYTIYDALKEELLNESLPFTN